MFNFTLFPLQILGGVTFVFTSMCCPQSNSMSAFISVEGVCLCAQVCACFIKSKECIQVLSKTFLKNALYQLILFWLCFSGLSFANCVMEQGNNMFQIISSTVCYRNCDFRTEQSCQRTDGQFPKKNNLFLYVHRYKNNYIFKVHSCRMFTW